MNSPLVVLLRLLVVHFLGDFLFQPDYWVSQRNERKGKSGWLLLHGLIYTSLIFLALAKWNTWFWVIPVVFLTHITIDFLKSSKQDTAISLVIDQVLHIVILVVIWVIAVKLPINAISEKLGSLWHSQQAWLVILSYVAVIWPVGIFIGKVTESWRKGLDRENRRGLARAGMWIGRLERVITLTFVLAGQPQGVGFLIAAKSVFRFGEISDPQNRKEAEYILIGSLLSFGIALGVGRCRSLKFPPLCSLKRNLSFS